LCHRERRYKRHGNEEEEHCKEVFVEEVDDEEEEVSPVGNRRRG
jgi:hypothetical protein